MSQALYLREFLETYDVEVIIFKVAFVPFFYYLLTQPFETKETTIFSLLHTTLIPFLLLNLLYQHRVLIIKIIMFMTLGTIQSNSRKRKKNYMKNSANGGSEMQQKQKKVEYFKC